MFDGIYISGQIENVDANITVDTGASVSLISNDLYHSIPDDKKPQLVKSNQQVSTANGVRLKCSGAAEFHMKLGPVVINKRLIVADIQDDVLLGSDFLQKDEKGPADLILSEDRMLYQGQSIPLQQVTTPVFHPEVHKARLVYDCTIPGMCEKTLEVMIENPPFETSNTCMLFEANQELAQNHSIIMAPCLLNMSEDNPVKAVRVMNPFNDTVTLRRGMVVASGQGIQPLESTEDNTVRQVCVEELTLSRGECEQGPTVVSNEELPPHLHELFNNTCSSMSQADKELVKQLLIEFTGVFSQSDEDLGLTHLTEHVIDTGNAHPVKQAPRRVPLAYTWEDKKALDKLLKQGCIRPSNSPWASPVVFVMKKDGSVRPCYDMRRVNELTVKDAFPLPRTEDCLDAVAGAKLFSTLDITSAYNQIPVREQDIPKTAFVTKYGLFEHVTMPFGLCNAPATFQRLMEIALNGLQWSTCLIYLDDVICFSSGSIVEHADRLRLVPERIRSANLKLKPRKCSLFQTSVRFLGHVISGEGVLPNPENVQRLADWPVPKRVKNVRAFLGLGNYYRRFVKNYSQLVKPLTELTKKNRVFFWTDECQTAFDALKKHLLGPEIMAYPNGMGEFILDCDACDKSIGAVVSQRQDGQERVIAYGSRTLNKAEQNYCVTDRELLAIKHFTELYKHYLLGRKFIIRSDHQPLKWLFSLKEPKGRVARWIEILSAYNFAIEYRPGPQHGNADGMSRCPDPRSCECDDPQPLPCGPCAKCEAKSDTMQSSCQGEVVQRVTAMNEDHPEGKPPHSILQTLVSQLFILFVFLGFIWASPAPLSNDQIARSSRTCFSSYSSEDLRKKQLEDLDIGVVLRWKEAGERPSNEDVKSLSAATRHYWLQ